MVIVKSPRDSILIRSFLSLVLLTVHTTIFCHFFRLCPTICHYGRFSISLSFFQTFSFYPYLGLQDTPQHWTAEQVRRFYAAIKVHGKNFHAIHKDYFSPATAVDPITGIGGGAVVEALTSRNARGRKRRGNTQVDAKIATPAIADPDMIKKEGEEEEDSKPGYDVKEEVKNTEGNDEDPEDEETEDVKDGDGEMCRPTSVLFRPTREKTVKQLVTFYYYWKRKSTSNITSAAAHAAAVAAAAAAAAVNTGAPFRGSTVEANFNRGFTTGKKRKTAIIGACQGGVMQFCCSCICNLSFPTVNRLSRCNRYP